LRLGAIGGYLVGSTAAPAKTVTETKTVTAAAATVTQTVTQTVTKTVTASPTPTTVIPTPTVTPPTKIKLVMTQHPVDPNQMYAKMAKKYSTEIKPYVEIEIAWGPTGGGAVAEYYRIQVEAGRARSPTLDIFNLDVIWGCRI
jgi:hypothetical protein